MRKCSLGAAVLLSVGLMAAPSTADGVDAPAPEVQAPASVPDELLVGFEPGAAAGERAEVRRQQGARLVETVAAGGGGSARVGLVALPAGADEAAVARRFARNPNVAFAEANWLYTTAAAASDPKYTDGRSGACTATPPPPRWPPPT